MDRGGAARLQGACLETALATGLTLPRTVVGLEDVSPDAPPQGDSLWIPPVHNVCGRLQGREAGRGPTSWGYYSTIVLILQWGDGGVVQRFPSLGRLLRHFASKAGEVNSRLGGAFSLLLFV